MGLCSQIIVEHGSRRRHAIHLAIKGLEYFLYVHVMGCAYACANYPKCRVDGHHGHNVPAATRAVKRSDQLDLALQASGAALAASLSPRKGRLPSTAKVAFRSQAQKRRRLSAAVVRPAELRSTVTRL